jgi:hypothetical protein
MAKTGFFAYSSEPADCGIAIEGAIQSINDQDKSIILKSWKQLQITGNLIIAKILNQIEASDFFCADVTGINENVLFELGFAIGKRKPIFIIQDTTITESYNKFKEFIPLTGIGHVSYTNSSQIVSGFFKEKPQESSSILLDNLIKDITSTDNKHALLYLKSQVDTNYSQLIVEKLDEFKLPTIVDDANEAKIQSLSWYLNTILTVPAVLVEFSQLFRAGHQIHNAKCAFIAGLSLGLGMRVQMIAAKPFPTTLDYQEYLKKYTNSETLGEAIDPFLYSLKSEIAQLLVQPKSIVPHKRNESVLQRTKFGEYIAEHESRELPQYYLTTAHYDDIVKSEYNIVVGRKGAGKTATLYYLQSTFSADVRNLIVPIKPINFDIDGLIEILKKLNSEFERGYIIQSIWKFLIYTEISRFIYETIKEKPVYALNELDNRIIDFISENNQIILTDFSTRVEQELINFELLRDINEQTAFRAKISEILHDNIIGHLKELIVEYMSKRKRLVVIIDNLDKNWHKGKDIEITSKFILGLLGVIGRIAKELKGSPKDPNDFDLNLVILLRADIFSHILRYSREPDKIERTLLKWDDPEVLFRLINSRLDYLSDGVYADTFWTKHVIPRVNGLGTKKFIISCILPRPRDLIFFLNSAKNKAISRGHAMIIEDDFLSAYKEYSAWVFQSLLVENGITIEQMESFLFNTIGEASILTKERIIILMTTANIPTDNENVQYFIDFLCSLSFIGREVRKNEFEYQYDPTSSLKIKILSDKLNSQRFKIHNAFIPFLECIDYIKPDGSISI